MIAPLPFRPGLRWFVPAALLLAGCADVLFFEVLGSPVGLPVPIFAGTVACAAAVCNHRTLGRASAVPAFLVAVALLALVENVAWNSLWLAAFALAAFALAAARRLPRGPDAAFGLVRFLAEAPLAIVHDDRRRRAAGRRGSDATRKTRDRARALAAWLMPVILASGFVVLLGAGNPILGRWLALIDSVVVPKLLDPVRFLFWALAIVSVWPFLRPRLRFLRPVRGAAAPAAIATQTAAGGTGAWSAEVFGPAAILRALLLFNAVFAVQSILDAVYLWGGAALPTGVSYAAYAHRGAYTLVATALLAAGFVLTALRPGATATADRRIRALVFLWIGQTVVLVLSAMLRLDLYVDVYALTHWRLAAFVWMGLVAVGLVLILMRIVRNRSNRWLVGANLAATAVVLSGTCFVDPEGFIARFNVAHSREVSGTGMFLDDRHLVSLGSAAIPAIDRFLVLAAPAAPARSATSFPFLSMLRDERERLATRHRGMSRDWRNWTFRNWRLSRYLDANAAPVPPAPPGPALPPAGRS